LNSLESQAISIADGTGEGEGNIASFDNVSREGASTAGSAAKFVQVCEASTCCGEIVEGSQTESVSVVALTDFFTVLVELCAVAVERFFLTVLSNTSFLCGVPVCRNFAIISLVSGVRLAAAVAALIQVVEKEEWEGKGEEERKGKGEGEGTHA
jgi:hypothetical protein